jgi:hypothetical protein
MTVLNRNKLSFVVLFLFLCILFRIDFRFKSTVECCSDDYDYFSHATTLAIDYDLDYSNQIFSGHPFYYEYNGKVAPAGFPGSGFLAAPFLFLGNLIDSITPNNSKTEILNYKLLFYSLSPIFYFFCGYFITFQSLINLNLKPKKFSLLIIIFGSGISYFAFERFSMTHAYEFFIISAIILSLIIFYKNGSTKSAIMIPVLLMSSFLVRMSNIFIFIIPLFIKYLIQNRFEIKRSLIKRYSFQITTLFTFLFYFYLSYKIYGRIIFNPQTVYGTNISFDYIIGTDETLLSIIKFNFLNLLKILFGNEFGIIWMSPILFAGFLSIFFNIDRKNFYIKFILLICFVQNFAIVLLWKSTAASYGFRYLYSLVPLSIIALYYSKDRFTINLLYKYTVLISIFSILGLIFFETTEQTQLSMVEITNSFGAIRNYSEPEYVTGLLKSFLQFNSYLIIFSTSLLGVYFFKTALLFFTKDSLLIFLANLGLPSDNSDFVNYINQLADISWYKISTITLFLVLIIYKVILLDDKLENNTFD